MNVDSQSGCLPVYDCRLEGLVDFQATCHCFEFSMYY